MGTHPAACRRLGTPLPRTALGGESAPQQLEASARIRGGSHRLAGPHAGPVDHHDGRHRGRAGRHRRGGHLHRHLGADERRGHAWRRPRPRRGRDDRVRDGHEPAHVTGAYVDAMLKAYRRTLQKTMDQARSMNEVVEQPEIAKLADTPDKAVVWGMALGLHREVAALLARGLEAQRAATGSPAGAYYPLWLGSSPGSAWSGASAADIAGGVSYGSGSGFSGSALPDIGGMFDALGSVGSTPASSSSSGGSGGGFGGGGGGGGGGGSGSF